LRFYDQNDLLRPQLVDEQTGYRYYAIGQVQRAALVRRLRAAEMPVGMVRRYLAADADERRAVLDGHLESFRERASAVQTAVNELRHDLDVGDARWCVIAPARLAEALERVRFAIADPTVRAELGGVWVETREDSLRVVATDSYRLAVRDLVPERIGSGGLRGMINVQHVVALASGLGSAGTVTLDQDAAGIVSVTIDGHREAIGHSGEGFPDYERILTGLPEGNRIAVGREAITQALMQLPTGDLHLRLDFEPGRLVLTADDREVTVAGSWSGPALRMFVDGRFFAEAVEAMVGPDLVLEVSGPLQPFTLRSADTGTFSVLTMPIRPPNAG
jgi:DNA-binding transcriptional MerR regulator